MAQSQAQPPRIAVVTCAVLEDEVKHFASDLPQVVHTEVMQQGLHNEPDELRRQVQEAITRIERAMPQVQAIVLGYGLCSRGTEGIATSRCLLVIPRAHDCITVLLGDRLRYAQYVKDHPGTYWYSPGWNRHHTPPGKDRHDKLLEKYRQKYGQENAQFLMEQEQNWFKTYNRATYVHLGVGVTPQDIEYTKQCAQWLGWDYDCQHGDPALLKDLLAGKWDSDRFVVLGPGQTLRLTADERIIEPQGP